MERKAYSTDLTEEQWLLIAPFFPCCPQGWANERRRTYAYLEILNGIFYVVRARCAWRLLPHNRPPSPTCYHYFRVWSANGLFLNIHDTLREHVRKSQDRQPIPSAAILNSQSVKTTEKGAIGRGHYRF